MIFGENFTMLLAAAFMVGGVSNPLYSLLIAHTNDFLEHEDMAVGEVDSHARRVAAISNGTRTRYGQGAAYTPESHPQFLVDNAFNRSQESFGVDGFDEIGVRTVA